jgi:hypothetical protein
VKQQNIRENHLTTTFVGDEIKVDVAGGTVTIYAEMRSSSKILVRKWEEKRSLGRHGHRWEDYIKSLKEKGNVDWTELVKDWVL